MRRGTRILPYLVSTITRRPFATVTAPASESVAATEPEDLTTKLGRIQKNYAMQNKAIIARILDVELSAVRKAPKKLLKEEDATEVYRVLRKEGFGSGEILYYPEILAIPAYATWNYIQIMNESLFFHGGIRQIIKFTTVYRRTLGQLVGLRILQPVPKVVENAFSILQIKENALQNNIWNALPVDTNRLTLLELRQIILSQYISSRLDTPVPQVDLMYPKYPRVIFRCFNWIKRCLDFLLGHDLLSGERILRHGYLLSGNPESMAFILKTIPSLNTLPLKKLITARPKILTCVPKALLEIEELFNLHKITPDSIARLPELYTLSPSTIRQRLEDFDSVPEFHPLKTHPRVTRLIYYQNMAKQRVEYLRDKNLPGSSLHLLCADKVNFTKHVSLGDVRTRGVDVVGFLFNYISPPSSSFKKTRIEVKKSLQRHPHWMHTPLPKVKDCLSFLDEYEQGVFTKEQIFSALPLTLYPKEKVEKVVGEIIGKGEACPRNDAFFLHLVLYHLEAPLHFSGDGVWETPRGVVSERRGHDDDHDLEEHRRRLHKLHNAHIHKKKGYKADDENDNDDDPVFGDTLQDTLLKRNAKNKGGDEAK